MVKFTQEEVILFKAIWDDKQFQKGLTETTQKLNKLQQSLLPKKLRDQAPIISEKQTLSAIKKVQKAEKQQANERKIAENESYKGMLRLQRGLLQGGLSIMFFGMQMKKFFEGIAQASLTTFMKLTTDTEMANNTINRLSTGVESIKFTLGEAVNTALEPFEDKISSIVDYVIDFIDTHPDVVTWGLAIGLVVGAVMMLVGQFTLLIIGLAATKFAFGTTGATGAISMGAIAKSVGLVIVKLFVLLAILLAIFGLLTNNKTVVNFFANIIVWIAKVIAAVMWGIDAVTGTLSATVTIAFKALAYGIKWIFEQALNIVISGINQIIKAYNWIADKVGLGQIKQIGKVNFTEGGLDISEETEKIKYLWGKESFNNWMSAAENVGEMFKSGIDTISTTLGINSQKKITDQNLAIVNKEAETVDKFSYSVDLFGQILANNPPAQNNSGTNNYFQPNSMFYGFSDTYINQ